MLRAIVIATAIGLAAPSYAQVRVITGDIEHVYSNSEGLALVVRENSRLDKAAIFRLD
jgi:hypothetical protein